MKLLTRRGLIRAAGIAAPAIILRPSMAQFDSCLPGICGVKSPDPRAWDPVTELNVTLSNGNLTLTSLSADANSGARLPASYARSSGKYYFETTFSTLTSGGGTSVGVGTLASAYNSLGLNATVGINMEPKSLGHIWSSGSFVTGLGTRSTGDVIGMAIDFDNLMGWFRVAPAGNWNGDVSANPATNTNGVAFAAGAMTPVNTFNFAGNVFTTNFGASAFSGTVPAGFTSGW